MKLSTRDRILVSLATVGVLAVGLFLLLTGTASQAGADDADVFVTPGGTGDCSQANPCDIQTALSTATDGDAIYLGAGAYTGGGGAVVTITESVTLYGGWDGTTDTPPRRDPDAHPTVLDGEETRPVVTIHGPAQVTLEGLTIARGSVLSTTTRGWHGAGLYARDTDLSILGVNVYSNVVDAYDVEDSLVHGGGVAVDGGTLLVEGSEFRWNSGWAQRRSSGGGLSISHTVTATVRGSLFQDNDAWHASGIYFTSDDQTPFTVTNNIIAGNQSTYSWLESPVVRVWGGDGTFLHNTAAHNDSAYGFQVDLGASVALTNTILVSHTVGISVTGDSTARLEGTLWGSGAWANGTDWDGDGDIVTGTVNVWGAPRFVDPDGGDYHIGVGSAARDRGVTSDVEDDIDGDSRPQDEGYDIGADEAGPQWEVYLPLTTKSHP